LRVTQRQPARGAGAVTSRHFVPTRRYIKDDEIAVPIVRAKRWEAITEHEFRDLADQARLSRKATIATVKDT
jgi:hypothetical protein